MLTKLMSWGLRRYIRGPAQSWIFTSGALLLLRTLTSATKPRAVVDVSSTKPGDRLVIEHLNVTHGEQAKEIKRARKASKKDEKAAKKAGKTAKKTEKAAKKAGKAAKKSGKTANKTENAAAKTAKSRGSSQKVENAAGRKNAADSGASRRRRRRSTASADALAAD